MRVLISASTFPLRSDDVLPRFVYDLAESLTSYCKVTVLAPDAPGASRQEHRGNVDVRRFTYFHPRRLQALAYGAGLPDNLRASWLAKLQLLPYLLVQAFMNPSGRPGTPDRACQLSLDDPPRAEYGAGPRAHNAVSARSHPAWRRCVYAPETAVRASCRPF